MDLVKRVARAIAAQKRNLPVDAPEVDAVCHSYCGQARAAIAEVLDAMGEVSRDLDIAGLNSDRRTPTGIWQAMLAQFKAENGI